MQWVRLDDYDRRTKAGRQIMAALRIGGRAHAAALAQRLELDAIRTRPVPGLTPLAVRPWRAGTASPSHKRRRVDMPKAPVKPRQAACGRPRRVMVDPDEVGRLIALLHRSGPDVQRMFASCTRLCWFGFGWADHYGQGKAFRSARNAT